VPIIRGASRFGSDPAKFDTARGGC
jgi:hypothetical protein